MRSRIESSVTVSRRLAAGIVDDELERRLFEDIARHGVVGIVAVLLAQ